MISYDPTVAMASSVAQQLQAAENRANLLEANLEEANRVNSDSQTQLGALQGVCNAMETRIAQLEKESRRILAAQPKTIVEALKRWTESDPEGLARALHAFLREAVS